MLRHIALLLLCGALTACGGTKAPDKADPAAPAVIGAQPVVLPGDTARPDTTAQTRERTELARRQLDQNYAFMSAMTANADGNALKAFYHPAATFSAPGFEAQGVANVVGEAIAMARRLSLRGVQRVSARITFLPDSIVADSGAYQLIAQRPGQAESIEQGAYATKWRMRTGTDWQVVSDHLYPSAPLAGAKKATGKAP